MRRPSRVAALASVAAIGIAAVSVAWALPIDDFWLAIASGRAILAGADAAHAIPLSWLPTLPGALNPQWGAQVILAAVDSLGWALLVNAALVAIGLGLTLARMVVRGRPAAVTVASLLCLAVLSVHLLARPQSFSIALFPLALLLFERFRDRWWLPVAVGALFAAWANLHGAFVVGQLVAGVTLADVAWARWRRPPSGSRRQVAICAVALLAALVAPLLNPAGPALLGYAYGQGTSDVVRAISVEWQPAWPWEPIGALFWMFALVLVAGRLARREGAGVGELLLGLALGVLAATGIRFIPWFVLATAPLFVSDVEALLARAPVLARGVGEVPAPLRGRRLVGVLAAVGGVCVGVQLLRPGLPPSINRLTSDEPVSAAEQLLTLSPGARTPVLNEQVWGGYLLWSLGDRVRSAMDGRIEIRSRDTWQGYFDLLAGKGDPVTTLTGARVQVAVLFPGRESLIGKLTAGGWSVTFRDANAVLLLRR